MQVLYMDLDYKQYVESIPGSQKTKGAHCVEIWDCLHVLGSNYLNILTLDPCRYINMAYICFVSDLEVFPRVKLWIPHIRLAKSLLDPSDPGNPDPTGFSGSRTQIKQKSTSTPQ